MELALKIIAAALIASAVYFYSIGETDWLFACIVLAACSFFINMRFGIKRRMDERAAEEAVRESETGSADS